MVRYCGILCIIGSAFNVLGNKFFSLDFKKSNFKIKILYIIKKLKINFL